MLIYLSIHASLNHVTSSTTCSPSSSVAYVVFSIVFFWCSFVGEDPFWTLFFTIRYLIPCELMFSIRYFSFFQYNMLMFAPPSLVVVCCSPFLFSFNVTYLSVCHSQKDLTINVGLVVSWHICFFPFHLHYVLSIFVVSVFTQTEQ